MPWPAGGLGLKVHTLPLDRDIPCVASTHTAPPRTPSSALSLIQHLPVPGPMQVRQPVRTLHASSPHEEIPFLCRPPALGLCHCLHCALTVCIAHLLSGLRASLGPDPCLPLLLWHPADFLYSQCLVTARDRRCPAHIFPGAPLSRLLLAAVSSHVAPQPAGVPSLRPWLLLLHNKVLIPTFFLLCIQANHTCFPQSPRRSLQGASTPTLNPPTAG